MNALLNTIATIAKTAIDANKTFENAQQQHIQDSASEGVELISRVLNVRSISDAVNVAVKVYQFQQTVKSNNKFFFGNEGN